METTPIASGRVAAVKRSAKVMQAVVCMIAAAACAARPKIALVLHRYWAHSSMRAAWTTWHSCTVVSGSRWGPSGIERVAGRGLHRVIRRVLETAVTLVREGKAVEGAALERQALVLAARVRVAWARWAEEVAMARYWMAQVRLHAMDGAADHPSLRALTGGLWRLPTTTLQASPRPWDAAPAYRCVGAQVVILSRRPRRAPSAARRRAGELARMSAREHMRAQREAELIAARTRRDAVRSSYAAACRGLCAVRLFTVTRDGGEHAPEVSSTADDMEGSAAAAHGTAAQPTMRAPATVKAGRRRRAIIPRTSRSMACDLAVAAALDAAAKAVVGSAVPAAGTAAHIGAARNIRARIAADAAAEQAAAATASTGPAGVASSARDGVEEGELRGAGAMTRGARVRRSSRISTRHDTESQ